MIELTKISGGEKAPFSFPFATSFNWAKLKSCMMWQVISNRQVVSLLTACMNFRK